MRLPSLLNNRAWSSVILLGIDVLIGGLATVAIMGCTGTFTSQELAPQRAGTESGAAAQPSSAPSLPVGQETVSTTGAPSQSDRDDLDTYQVIPVGFTEEGSSYLGLPDTPITLEEYSDLLCPFCARHFEQTWPTLLNDYVRSGQVKYFFRDMPLASLHPTAPMGHVAARRVAEQGDAYFWAMHAALFARQNEWNRLPNPSGFLAGVAEGIRVGKKATVVIRSHISKPAVGRLEGGMHVK
jgi:protein-disulfide isomerase